MPSGPQKSLNVFELSLAMMSIGVPLFVKGIRENGLEGAALQPPWVMRQAFLALSHLVRLSPNLLGIHVHNFSMAYSSAATICAVVSGAAILLLLEKINCDNSQNCKSYYDEYYYEPRWDFWRHGFERNV